MAIPTVADGNRKVLQIAVVWTGTDKSSARAKSFVTAGDVGAGCVNVLDHLCANHNVKRLASELLEHVIIRRHHLEPSLGISSPG